jgi:hypothetical protein
MDEELTVKQLIARLEDRDAEVRAAAVQNAGKLGAAAVIPLAKLMAETEEEPDQLEVGRAAKRALWAIVRHVGRPGADNERRAVEGRLCRLLYGRQVAVGREVLWMLSEIGGDEAVAAIREIPGILEDTDIRDDARCAVERIPGEAAKWALLDGLEASTDDFRLALAHSMRVHGVEVDEKKYPPQKLIPTKQTKVEPVST